MYDTSSFTTSSLNSSSSTDALSSFVNGMGSAIIFVILAALIIFVICYAINAILLGKLFKKAGIKPIIAWIPIYNSWKLLEMGDQPGFWAVLMLIPAVQFISTAFTFIAMYKIGKKMGKSDWFVILGMYLPIVWTGILALDKSTWNGQMPETTAPTASTPTDYVIPAQAPEAAPAGIVTPIAVDMGTDEPAVATMPEAAIDETPAFTPSEPTATTPEAIEMPAAQPEVTETPETTDAPADISGEL